MPKTSDAKSAAVVAPAEPPRPPTPLANRLVRYILGFGVGVGAGLAPFLGKVQVPGFDALVQLIPTTMHSTVFPVSAFAMGMVAVLMQWFAGDSPTKAWLRRQFRRGMIAVITGLLLFIVIQSQVVYPLNAAAVGHPVPVLIGFGERRVTPECPREMPLAECIRLRTAHPDQIASLWGEANVGLARLSLLLSYLLTTVAFGWIVGLLVLQAATPKPSSRQAKTRLA